MEFKERKKIRIPGYNYSTSGYYFITICTENRKEILSRISFSQSDKVISENAGSNENVGDEISSKLLRNASVSSGLPDGPNETNLKSPVVYLTRYGKIVENQINIMADFYDEIRVDKYVIMPNHVHFLLEVRNGMFGPSRTMVPTMYSLTSRFIGTFKRFVNKEIGKNIWQPRSYDHVIRNEKDYLEIWKYIEYNPCTWNADKLNDNI